MGPQITICPTLERGRSRVAIAKTALPPQEWLIGIVPNVPGPKGAASVGVRGHPPLPHESRLHKKLSPHVSRSLFFHLYTRYQARNIFISSSSEMTHPPHVLYHVLYRCWHHLSLFTCFPLCFLWCGQRWLLEPSCIWLQPPTLRYSHTLSLAISLSTGFNWLLCCSLCLIGTLATILHCRLTF
jgi:hypothetical protein